jgi:hypothetical protein
MAYEHGPRHLKQLPGLGLPQRKFLATLFVTILVVRGRVNFRNLSRACDDAERTIARQFREPWDGPDCHQRVRMTALDPHADLVSAHDASFIPQRGTQTVGRGHFFTGGASRAEGGLEIATLAVVDVTRRGAFTLAVSQTPPGEEATTAEPADPRGDCYTPPRRAHRPRWPTGVTEHGVAGDEAKKQDLDAGGRLHLHAITHLRRAADCLVLDPGPPPKRRGARRQAAGKVHCRALSRFAALGPRAEAPQRHLDIAVVWHKTRQRRLRLVVLLHRTAPAQPRLIVLGATAPELHGHTLIALSAARFHSECRCRDSPQCPGLLDGQARAESA